MRVYYKVLPLAEQDLPLPAKPNSSFSFSFEVFSTGWLVNQTYGYLDFNVVLETSSGDSIRVSMSKRPRPPSQKKIPILPCPAPSFMGHPGEYKGRRPS